MHAGRAAQRSAQSADMVKWGVLVRNIIGGILLKRNNPHCKGEVTTPPICNYMTLPAETDSANLGAKLALRDPTR
jgi:hypothetical protein